MTPVVFFRVVALGLLVTSLYYLLLDNIKLGLLFFILCWCMEKMSEVVE